MSENMVEGQDQNRRSILQGEIVAPGSLFFHDRMAKLEM